MERQLEVSLVVIPEICKRELSDEHVSRAGASA